MKPLNNKQREFLKKSMPNDWSLEKWEAHRNKNRAIMKSLKASWIIAVLAVNVSFFWAFYNGIMCLFEQKFNWWSVAAFAVAFTAAQVFDARIKKHAQK
jgi:ABC-type spermidine/putrescine transport system permease subunit II